MQFEVIDQVPYSLEDVFSTMRDKLPDLIEYLPDVKSITCDVREELPGNKLKLVNKWMLENRIPKALAKFIKPEQLGYIDHAEWDNDGHFVDYRLEMIFLSEYIDVHGRNYFTAEGDGTKVRLTGELNLDLARHPMLPKFLAKSITGQVEKLVLALVKPNLVKVNRGVEKHLAK